ncbi:MAG: NDP-sugar synthase [Deltaproteobacteria bacterium]|jgi:mannose-1-phosphate guanylyltransferase|nr:NDP-sugar synthase [Deltaproteobacteria bacterium]
MSLKEDLKITKKNITSAIVLSAGLSERLRPLSLLRPKPLFPVLNQPMLLYWLKKLQALGVRKVIVNVHYLGNMIKSFLDNSRGFFPDMEIIVSEEDLVLGTGGGLKQARNNFDGPFLAVNSDIYTDFPLENFIDFHFQKKNQLTMAVLDYPEKATVSIADERILGFREPQRLPGEKQKLCGAGLMILDPEVLDAYPSGKSDIVDQLNLLIPKGIKILAYHPDEPFFWTDIGNPHDYFCLNQYLAKGRHFIQEGVRLEGMCSGFLVAEAGAYVAPGAFVQDCILWENAVVEDGAHLESMIVAGRALASVKLIGGVITGV